MAVWAEPVPADRTGPAVDPDVQAATVPQPGAMQPAMRCKSFGALSTPVTMLV